MYGTGEASQRQISYDITYMWNLKKQLQMNLLIKQKQTQKHGYQRVKVVRRHKLGVWDERMHTTINKRMNNKVLLYSTGNYFQYLKKNLKKKNYIHIYNIHFAVHQKLTQRCK